MPKRLTDTGKWDDPWFQDLPSKYKLLWIYLLDKCDHAGIWEVNFKNAIYFIGEHLEQSEVKRVLQNRVNFMNDKYWNLVKFIDFQYGGVKNDSVGKSVQKVLKRHNLLGAMEGLGSPLAGSKDKDKDKDKVKVKVKDSPVQKNENDGIVRYGIKSGFKITVNKKFIHDKIKIVYDLKEYFMAMDQLDDLTAAGFTLFEKFMEANPGRAFNDDGHVYNSFKTFCSDKRGNNSNNSSLI